MWSLSALRGERWSRGIVEIALLALVSLTNVIPGSALAVTPLTTERVASFLVAPVFVTAPPADFDRLFIVAQLGRIQILNIGVDPPQLEPTVFLDISDRVVAAGLEQGLLGLAFHPNFSANRFFYVNYTGASGDTFISRFEVPQGTPNAADPTSELVLLQISQPQSNHNGGWIGFSPIDGMLYVATGDGGGANDAGSGHSAGTGNAQDVTQNLLGKMLRIDVDGTNGSTGNYGIPPGNPFVGTSGDDEIWSYGLRNPWRSAFDRETGDLFIGDVGQGSWEELNFQPAASSGGENWGWRCREGNQPFASDPGCATATFSNPFVQYPHLGTPFRCSVTGGEIYRGCAIPDLEASYFFADFCSDQIYSVQMVGGLATSFQERTAELAPPGLSIDSISSFGTDARGEIYIVDYGGELFKIVPDGVESQCVDVSLRALSPWPLLLGIVVIGISSRKLLGSVERA